MRTPIQFALEENHCMECYRETDPCIQKLADAVSARDSELTQALVESVSARDADLLRRIGELESELAVARAGIPRAP